eukprot:GHVT01030148.1.p3 GENE.GHVT01030148.1~~GHVT01030148.1.p3  ORF type:complete len:103 (-),score=14.68 GHVT01030148.1:588-896(-)
MCFHPRICSVGTVFLVLSFAPPPKVACVLSPTFYFSIWLRASGAAVSSSPRSISCVLSFLSALSLCARLFSTSAGGLLRVASSTFAARPPMHYCVAGRSGSA